MHVFHFQAKTAPSSMHVPQVPVPMGLAVPIGITTTTARVNLAIRGKTAAMTLMSAASLGRVSMAASALTLLDLSGASASKDTVGVHVRCPPYPVPHLSALMEGPVARQVTIPTSVLV